MGLLDTEVAKWKRAFGLLGGIPKTFKNNPRNAETMDAVFGFGGIIPGIGDAVSAAEAKYRYDQGDMLGAGLAGVGALPMVPSLAGMFVGKGAKTWDVLKEAEAMKRLKAGENPAQVWRDTGVAVAPWDKQVRGEIADNAAKVRESVLSDIEKAKPYVRKREVTEADLRAIRGLRDKWDTGEFIPHQQLANAYPETTKIPVELDASIDAKGSWDGSVIRFSPEATSNDMSSTTIHELQHATQQREGFASGGSPEAMRKILSDDPAMQAIYSSGELNDAYRRLAGEAEARLTQHRIPLSAEERLSQYPYDPEYFQKATGVPLDSLIVRYGDGPAMSTGRPRNHLGQEIPPTPYELAHAEAQRVAALPVEQGGLGLPPDNTAMDRARAMGFDSDMYHGGGPDLGNNLLSSNRGGIGDLYASDSTDVANSYAITRGPGYDVDNAIQKFEENNGYTRYTPTVYPLKSGKLEDLDALKKKDILDILGEDKVIETYKNWDNSYLDDIDFQIGLIDEDKAAKRLFMKDRFQNAHSAEDTESLTRSSPSARFLASTGLADEYYKKAGSWGGMYGDAEAGDITNAVMMPHVRSRFAAFNPAKRDSADLLAGLAPWALPVGATLLGGSFLLPPEEY